MTDQPADTTTTTAHLDPNHVGTIVEMLQRGRRVSEVIAAGLNVQGGWRRNDVIDVVSARGWKLDSDGRIPSRFRTTTHLPASTVPGAPAPAGGRPASWPEHGSRQPDPPLRSVPTATGVAPAADSASGLLNAGKTHTQPRVRKLAEKAEAALIALRAALSQETEREKVRARLAELDAERVALRTKLGGPGRPPKAEKPINHGTLGGYRVEANRGLDHCEPCATANREHMQRLRARKGPVTAA